MTTYRIKLTHFERVMLLDWVKNGKQGAKKIQKAQVLLASDETVARQIESVISAAYHLSLKSVERIRKAFFEAGLALFEAKPRQARSDRKIDGKVEAHLNCVGL